MSVSIPASPPGFGPPTVRTHPGTLHFMYAAFVTPDGERLAHWYTSGWRFYRNQGGVFTIDPEVHHP